MATKVNRKRKSKPPLHRINIVVRLNPTVLDPQGGTIQRLVSDNGFPEVSEVRQGKYFEVTLKEGTSQERADEVMRRLGKDVLTNPVTERYEIV
ncbi:MAG: phosphoribosylformylglycinamidine synthase, purS protein [Candidatus Doudnabacteria bacterium RIFCSPHIGHO2_01_FULL_49_9]|uniref:Phosphoribosylformylglycinamidine synthase subunit PurS n=1 Tax=Candidatus Doudnabacteria bacterium RIFCSPHIGHO2_01_FULL_49_9 TaxID=1817827 RepID=A0A1F5P389_9BACT|nr:MAG: phosphoribosylformylglycinamidine synthase, purS protein [Candidatus Doudnabacteria bacterium RIFCSPHIGHO2_01_FULL_49_9]